MLKNKFPVEERTTFLILVTFLGGYLDAYTYVTRGKVFANNHTGNVAKLGVTLAQGDYSDAMQAFIPIVACILGAVAAEFVRFKIKDKLVKGDWRITALILQMTVLFGVGFIPLGVPDIFVNTLISFITGFQLCLFRVWEGSAHNTTICTGNLRNLGQLLFKALDDRSYADVLKFMRYACLLFSFTFGAGVSTWVCELVSIKAVWGGCVIIVCMVAIMFTGDVCTKDASRCQQA